MEDYHHHEKQHQDNVPVASMSQDKESEPEVLEITLNLSASYPPPPTIVATPPVAAPRFTSPPSDLEECMETPKAKKGGKGKKGGPVVSQQQNDENCILNVTPGPVPALVGTCLINGTWE